MNVKREIDRKEIDFFYRGTSLPNNLIITSVKLKGNSKLKKKLKKNKMN